MIGAVLCGACPAALVWIPGITLPAVFAVVCVLAFGICLLVVPLTSILSYLVPAKDNGKAVGLVHTTGYAGSIVSTYLGGYLLTVTGSYIWPFGLYVGSMVISLFILLAYAQALRRSRKRSQAGRSGSRFGLAPVVPDRRLLRKGTLWV